MRGAAAARRDRGRAAAAGRGGRRGRALGRPAAGAARAPAALRRARRDRRSAAARRARRRARGRARRASAGPRAAAARRRVVAEAPELEPGEVEVVVVAPPGRLGVVFADDDDGRARVRKVKENSPLAGDASARATGC